ncbi:MAG TPA: hypothetical protein VGF67_17650 [Ktedonobacteraceae bacterium]|jgi:hypothetical protein
MNDEAEPASARPAEEQGEHQQQRPLDASAGASPPAQDVDVRQSDIGSMAIGTNSSVTNNYYYVYEAWSDAAFERLTEDQRRRFAQARGGQDNRIPDNEQKQARPGIKEKVKEIYNDEEELVARENAEAEAAASVDEQAILPENIASWYRELPSSYERYFIQALASLYKAPFNDVMQATWLIWKQRRTESEADFVPPGRTDLHMHTLSTTRKINGVDRTFWRNHDVQAQWAFTLRILRFLAYETAVVFHDQSFTDILCGWVQAWRGESASKAAYAAGVLLCDQSSDDLKRQANAWANSENGKLRKMAASLLSGAYDIEKLNNPETANNERKSPVFQLLNQWVQNAENARNPRMGSAAVHTYRLLSHTLPDVALAGLARLLCFPTPAASQDNADWQAIALSVWVETVSAYVGVARTGHVRKVLARLASIANILILQTQRPTKAEEREAYEQRRQLNLCALLDIFSFIALASLNTETEETRYSADAALPAQPALPGDKGQDTLLAGILSTPEARWRGHLLTLFSTALLAARESEAFFFLGEWADRVVTFAQVQDELFEAYVQFLVNLGRIIQAREHDLRERKLKTRPAYKVFLHQLNLLKNQQRSILIARVLAELSC